MNKNNTTYKQTAIGLIPSDWEVKKLGSFTDIRTGKKDNQNKNENGLYPFFVRSQNIERINSFSYDGEAILIPGEGNIGEIFHYLIGKFDFHQRVYKVSDFRNANGKYFYFSISHFFRKETVKHSVKATVDSLRLPTFTEMLLPIPPLPEQQKIATILSTWDAAIDTCKTIIEKLQIRNKGLAQKLLTGKIRVKGFEKTKWKFLPINKIAKEISLKNPTDKELTVMSCTKYDGLVPSLEYFGRKIYSDDLTTYKIVKKGQFAYATNHIEEGSIGYQSIFDEALISPMYTVFQTDDTINDNLLFKILKSHEYIHQYQKRMEGSIDRRGGLRWDEFSKIKVPIIDLEEQKAIANILDTTKTELNQYQQKLQTLQLQKKGLMQQLLTGKTRVKI